MSNREKHRLDPFPPSPPGRLAVGLAALLATGLAALLVPATAGPLRAQEPETSIDSPYRWLERGLRVAPHLGYAAMSRGNLEFGPGPTVVGGAAFRARVSSPISLEVGIGLGSSDRFVVDPRPEDGPEVVDTVSSSWARAAVALQVALTGRRTWHGLQPYVVLGGGLLRGLDEERSPVFSDSTEADLRYEIGTAPLLQAGVGVELRPSERLGVGFELRDHLIRLRTPEGFFDPDVLGTIEDAGGEAPRNPQWPHNLELSLGLWYYL